MSFTRLVRIGTKLPLLAAVAAALPAAPAAGDGSPAPTIVFVCEHGVGRSPIAAAYFNRLAEAHRLPHRALSRGTKPDAALPPVVREGLVRDGFDVAALAPARVSPEDLGRAERIVVFGTPLPGRAAVEQKVIDIPDVPGPGAGYERARDAIRAHVERLIEELRRGPDATRRK